MAEAETVEHIRIQLLGVAKQSQSIADALKSGRPIVGEAQ
jgi:septum formation inhibitor-activating ATPase MinD